MGKRRGKRGIRLSFLLVLVGLSGAFLWAWSRPELRAWAFVRLGWVDAAQELVEPLVPAEFPTSVYASALASVVADTERSDSARSEALAVLRALGHHARAGVPAAIELLRSGSATRGLCLEAGALLQEQVPGRLDLLEELEALASSLGTAPTPQAGREQAVLALASIGPEAAPGLLRVRDAWPARIHDGFYRALRRSERGGVDCVVPVATAMVAAIGREGDPASPGQVLVALGPRAAAAVPILERALAECDGSVDEERCLRWIARCLEAIGREHAAPAVDELADLLHVERRTHAPLRWRVGQALLQLATREDLERLAGERPQLRRRLRETKQFPHSIVSVSLLLRLDPQDRQAKETLLGLLTPETPLYVPENLREPPRSPADRDWDVLALVGAGLADTRAVDDLLEVFRQATVQPAQFRAVRALEQVTDEDWGTRVPPLDELLDLHLSPEAILRMSPQAIEEARRVLRERVARGRPSRAAAALRTLCWLDPQSLDPIELHDELERRSVRMQAHQNFQAVRQLGPRAAPLIPHLVAKLSAQDDPPTHLLVELARLAAENDLDCPELIALLLRELDRRAGRALRDVVRSLGRLECGDDEVIRTLLAQLRAMEGRSYEHVDTLQTLMRVRTEACR